MSPSPGATPSKRHMLVADLGLFYCSLVWGSTFFIVKDALAGVDPVTMVGYRFLIAGGALAIWLTLRGQTLFKDIRVSLLLSAVLLVLYVTQTIGLQYTTASNSGFITGLFILFVPIFLVTIFKRRPTPMEWIASVVAIIGLWILTGGLNQMNFGDVITLASAMTYALHVLLSDKYMKAGVDPLRTSCLQFLFVGVGAIIMSAVTGRSFAVGGNSIWWVILFLAFLPTLSAFVIQMFAQRHTLPLRVSLIFALEPVFAGVFAWTIGGEQLTANGAIGGLTIFCALFFSGLPWPPWRRPTS